jgi:hypothetical protein
MFVKRKYRIRQIARGVWEIRHPDGYWVGPGLGMFSCPRDAMEWLNELFTRARKRLRDASTP